jgi:hypothetical protein
VPNVETLLTLPPGFSCASAAFVMAGLDEQLAQIRRDVAGLSPADLERQHAPGMNTIGMLLTHIAVAEVHILHIGVLARPDSDVKGVTGISMDDEGMPLPADGLPAPTLAGKDLAFFDDLLDRARAETRRVLLTLEESDFDRRVVRPRADGSKRIFDVRWILYHLLEHQAGHHYQIKLLRHLYRADDSAR